jgi:hypothetical protein
MLTILSLVGAGMGHLSQIVWKSTPSIGCATIGCSDGGLANTGPDITPWFTVSNYNPVENSQSLVVLAALVAEVAKENTPGERGDFGMNGVIARPMMADSTRKACRPKGRPSVNS